MFAEAKFSFCCIGHRVSLLYTDVHVEQVLLQQVDADPCGFVVSVPSLVC